MSAYLDRWLWVLTATLPEFDRLRSMSRPQLCVHTAGPSSTTAASVNGGRRQPFLCSPVAGYLVHEGDSEVSHEDLCCRLSELCGGAA